MNFDEIDNKIIEILEENARITYREIEKEIGLSIGTIHNRIKKLKESEIIEGFTVKTFKYGMLEPLDFIKSLLSHLELPTKLIEHIRKYIKIREA